MKTPTQLELSKDPSLPVRAQLECVASSIRLARSLLYLVGKFTNNDSGEKIRRLCEDIENISSEIWNTSMTIDDQSMDVAEGEGRR